MCFHRSRKVSRLLRGEDSAGVVFIWSVCSVANTGHAFDYRLWRTIDGAAYANCDALRVVALDGFVVLGDDRKRCFGFNARILVLDLMDSR